VLERMCCPALSVALCGCGCPQLESHYRSCIVTLFYFVPGSSPLILLIFV
jgi:hypothetical protein